MGTKIIGQAVENSNNNEVNGADSIDIESLVGGPLCCGKIEKSSIESLIGGPLYYKVEEENTADQFKVPRPVRDSKAGTVSTEEMEIKVPLLEQAPISSLQMDESTVIFENEVKTRDIHNGETKEDASSTPDFKLRFGLSTNITGNVSSDSSRQRKEESSATYKIHARASQQPLPEGMTRINSLLTQEKESLRVDSDEKSLEK